MKTAILGMAVLALTGCITGQGTGKMSGPILIIGDSVSEGYTPYVEDAMPCVSHARAPHYADNSRDSGYVLKLLPLYFDDGKQYAVIHFNVGLWDIAHRAPNPHNQFKLGDANTAPISTSPDDYRLNLQAIIDSLHSMQPQAMLIFATTTDVPPDSIGRRPEDVDAYNRIAIEVMAENGVGIDDLHDWIAPYPYLHKLGGKNKVHYTAQGNQLLAQKVIDTLSQVDSCDTTS